MAICAQKCRAGEQAGVVRDGSARLGEDGPSTQYFTPQQSLGKQSESHCVYFSVLDLSDARMVLGVASMAYCLVGVRIPVLTKLAQSHAIFAMRSTCITS